MKGLVKFEDQKWLTKKNYMLDPQTKEKVTCPDKSKGLSGTMRCYRDGKRKRSETKKRNKEKR